MRNKPKAQEIYRHFKGRLYQIITLASHSESGEEYVVYQALYDDFKIFARPLRGFMEEIDRLKHSGSGQRYRFILLERTELDSLVSQADLKEQAVSSEKSVDIEVKQSEVDPLVLEFLSAKTYEERLQILSILHTRITDAMINTMAVSLDLEIAEGEVEKRYDELRHCLLTMRKFEIKR